MRNRRGFALPMVILIIAILTAALAAGFSATTAEITTNAAQRGSDRAFAIAQSGLEQFLVRRNEAGFCQSCMADPADSTNSGKDSARVTVPRGYVDVVATRVHPYLSPASPAIFFVRARGVDTSKVALGGAGRTTRPERTVGMYVSYSKSSMNVLAGWTSLSGISKQGSSGIISGNDACSTNPQPSVAGVSVPKGDWSQSGNFQPQGNPPFDSSKTLSQLAAAVKIDWKAIRDGNAIPADFTIPGDAFPTTSWFNADTSRWPVIHITTNYSLPNAGRGTIIVDGDFTISGSNMWDGVILVGGKLTSNGNNTTSGATVSGLNLLIGGYADPGDAQANGTKSYVYNSCNVSRATQSMRSYRAMPNTWMDNVVSW